MPNHVLHRMVITGEAESIRELHDACFSKEKPAPDEWLLGALEQARKHGDAEREKELAAHVAEIEAAPEYDVFDFNRIIPAPAFIMRAGNLKSGSREEKTGRNWYEWNTRNWGTKWGAYDLHIEEREPERLAFRFSTAWSVPEPVLETLARHFPELRFDIEFIDEMPNFWGVAVAENGVLSIEEYADHDDGPSKELRDRLCRELMGYDPDEDEKEETENIEAGSV